MWSQGSDSMTLEGPFQLGIFCDPMILRRCSSRQHPWLVFWATLTFLLGKHKPNKFNKPILSHGSLLGVSLFVGPTGEKNQWRMVQASTSRTRRRTLLSAWGGALGLGCSAWGALCYHPGAGLHCGREL